MLVFVIVVCFFFVGSFDYVCIFCLILKFCFVGVCGGVIFLCVVVVLVFGGCLLILGNVFLIIVMVGGLGWDVLKFIFFLVKSLDFMFFYLKKLIFDVIFIGLEFWGGKFGWFVRKFENDLNDCCFLNVCVYIVLKLF